MKLNIVKILAALMVLIGIVGIAAADPCPALHTWNNFPTSNDVLILQQDLGGNLIQYFAKSVTDKNPTNGVPGFREVCIASSAGVTSASSDWVPWSVTQTIPFVEFRGGGDPDNIPFDGNTYEVGSIQWNGVPNNYMTLVHINDDALCLSLGQNPDTCYVRPPNPPPIVPELGTLILTTTGLFGIVYISRKYGGK